MADSRLSALSTEALSDATSSRLLAAQSIEVLTDIPGVAERQLAATAVEVLSISDGIPERRIGSLSIEVLVPRKFTFTGWGAPMNSPSW